MPLINLNKKEDQNQNNTSVNNSDPVSNTVSSLGKDMNLEREIPVNQNQDGVKEYNGTSTTPPSQSNTQQPGDPQIKQDISQQLGDKLQNLNQNQFVEQNNPNQSVGSMIQASQLKQKQYDLEDFLRSAIKMNASDIHLTAGYRVMVRVNGELQTLDSNILSEEEVRGYADKLLSGRDMDLDKLKEVDFSYSFDNRRFRMNVFRQMNSFSVAARLVSDKIKTLEELELPPILAEFTKISNGLVLFTGPTGSGKSTSIAALLDRINKTQSQHIITLEDPIEYVFEPSKSLVDQREYGIDFANWPRALKSALRQDPDVILVGEMRDLETISSTITLAETGHLAFATLHTNSAAQSIDRIIDVFPEGQQDQIRTQLANILMAVVSQRLVPVKSGGRKAVMEIMVATPAIKSSIRDGRIHQIDNIIQTSQDFGMVSLEKALANLIKKGEISLDIGKSFSAKPAELETIINKSV